MHSTIVACARGWIGTSFHHQGRLKKTKAHKGGVDCLGLLVGIATELRLPGADNTLLAAADEADYSHQPDSDYLQSRLAALLKPVPAEAIVPGDIVLLSIDDSPQHLAVVSDKENGLGIIHAYAPARAVVEHVLDDWWRSRIRAAFRIF